MPGYVVRDRYLFELRHLHVFRGAGLWPHGVPYLSFRMLLSGLFSFAFPASACGFAVLQVACEKIVSAQWVALSALRFVSHCLHESSIGILGWCKQAEMLLIAAPRISADMIYYKAIRNWANEQLVNNSMHHFWNRISACFYTPIFQFVRFLWNVSGPFPTVVFSVHLNALKDAFPNVSAWSSCLHSNQPTRAPKVKSANERPQSGHELENRLFSFFLRLLQSRALTLQNAVGQSI